MAVTNPFRAIGSLFARELSRTVGRAAKAVQRVLQRSGLSIKNPLKPLPPGRRTSPLPKYGTTSPSKKDTGKPFETKTVEQVFNQPDVPPDWQFPEGKTYYATDTDQFLGGIPINVESEHVRWVKYVEKDQQLFICYHGGQDLNAVYQYDEISQEYALKVWNAGSHVGTMVWDYLRRRGTVFGYQKPYTGPFGGDYSPKYEAKEEWRHEHGAIPASGALPAKWMQGDGPYDPEWLARHNRGVIPQGKRQRSARGKGKNPWWYGG